MPPITRKQLNIKQLHILHTLYKFRYGTEQLFATQQAVSRRYIHERLRVLCEQQYIGRTYDGSYRIAGKPAYYYLLPKGIALLKQKPQDFDYQVLRNIRKDVNGSQAFVRHCLYIFAVYSELKQRYGESLRFFTGSYVHKYDYFPQPLPDAYATIKQEGKLTSRQFIIECFDTTKPDFIIKKRIERLVEHSTSGNWPAETYPGFLFVCDNEMLKKKVDKWSFRIVENSWNDDLVIVVKTRGTLVGI